jgi:ubiquinone/menaquinone biosynthesis C-methylase UbiE
VTRSKLEARGLYDRLSRWYDLIEGRWERRVVKEGLSLLAPQPGEHLLEIGPGTGWALVRLADGVGPPGLVVGLDLSPGMLKVAGRRLRKGGLHERVQLRLGDVSHLTFADGSFDAVFATFVLELLDTPDIPVALAQIWRTLKPGGRLVVVSLSRRRMTSARRLYEWAHERLPRLLDCRPIDVGALIAAAGFTVETARLDSVEGLPVEIVLARRPV